MQGEIIGGKAGAGQTSPGLYYEPGANCVVLAADEYTAIVVQSDNSIWVVGESYGSISEDAVLLPTNTKITINN